MKTKLLSTSLKTRILSAIALGLVFAFSTSLLNAQTILINPAGDGGFANGNTFAANGWTVSNSSNNPWVLDSLYGYSTSPITGMAAYIRDTGNTVAYYDNSKTCVNYFYRNVTVPAGESKIILSFNWMQNGENNWDIWQVFVSDTNITPVATTTYPGSGGNIIPVGITGAVYIANGAPATGVQTTTINLPPSLAGTTFRLIFAWKSDGSLGSQPPAIIDNISLTSQAPLITNAGGIFTINNLLPTGGSNFNNFTDAITDLNSIANPNLLNPLIFNVTAGQTFNGNIPEILYSGNATNRVIFQKSGAGPNPVVVPTGGSGTTDCGICIGGADYITFDGIDVTAANNTLEYGYRIRNISATNGAKHIIVRNANIRLDSTNTNAIGLIHTSSTAGGGFTAGSAGGQNDSCQYHNLNIINCGLGGVFITSGSTSFLGYFNRVWNVTVGTPYTGIPTGNIGGLTIAASYGIQFNNQSDFEVYNCEIRNIVTSGVKRGIWVQGGRGNNKIYNNRIYGIRNNSTTGTSIGYGIQFTLSSTGTNSIDVYNNEISDITAAYTGTATATRVITGMNNGTGGATNQINVSNNTVVIDGSGSPNVSSVCLEWGGSTAIYNVRNNNLVNLTGAQTGVAKHYVVRSSSVNSVGAATSIVRNNNYYIANTTNGFIGLRNTTDAATLADWRTNITTPANVDTNTVTVNPLFVNLAARNFTPQNDTLDNAGVPVAGVTTDINGNARNSTTPDIGSIEFTLATPAVTTANVTSITQNSATTGGVIAPALPAVTASGIVYSTSPNPVIGGPGVTAIATSPLVGTGSFTINLSGLTGATTYYVRAYATNAKGTSYGNQIQFTTSFTYPFVENFDGNWNPNSNGWKHTRFFYTGTGDPAPLNSVGPKDWMQNKNLGSGIWQFQGFATNPNNAVSDSGVLWLEDFYFATTNGSSNLNYSRVETPGIDLSTATSPYVRFYYYANQSANYEYPLILMASTDNGATWKSIMRIQPNADVSTTSTSGTGSMLSSTPWQRITVKVPPAFISPNTKFAFYRNAAYSFSGNLFIDSLYIADFTPTTITSAQTGNWSNPSTWVGGVVPNADNHVVIASGHTVTSDVNIARMQNLTVNGTFIFFSSSTLQTAQIFGNLTINSGGVFNAGITGNSAISRFIYIGEGLTNSGTLNMGTSTGHSIFFVGGIPSTITNNGTITNNYISQVHFANSGGITFNPASSSNVVIRNTVNLVDGDVTPNGRLTVGLSGNSNFILRGVPEARFTARPIYPNLGTSIRSVTYGGGINGNFQMAVLSRDTIFPGNETDSLPTGVNFIRGTLTLNTNHHVKLNRPLQVGDTLNRTTTTSATTGVGGTLTFTRGLLFTDATNILTVGPNSTGSAGAIPSYNTVNPPTTHGSYIIGPVRFVRPQTGTLTSTVNVPFGLGSDYMGAPIINNTRRYITISAGGGWSGQILECEMLPIQGGSVNPPQSALIGRNVYRIHVLENRQLPATSTVLLSTTEETGKSNRDILYGTQDQLFVMQSPNINGPWSVRSTSTGTGAFAQNTIYTRTTATAAPGPVSGNGSFFTFGTTAPVMLYTSGQVRRNTAGISAGAQNMEMLRIRVDVNGVVPVNATALQLNTTGTTNAASIANAKVYYTGADSNFNMNQQLGSTVTNPSGNFNVNFVQQLQNGSNYFWVAYDIAGTATLGEVLVANLNGIVVADTLRTPAAVPATGGRTVSAPMTFVAANAYHGDLTRVEQNSFNNEILRFEVEMSLTGAQIPLNSITFNTNGSANPTNNISNAKIFYTGSSPVFSTNTLFGSFSNPGGSHTITGNVNLNNGMNYFWLVYDIPAGATIGDSVDAEITSLVINGIPRTVGITAPAGSRQIRAPYCVSAATTTADGEILNVTVGSLNNTSTCTTTGGPGSILNMYSNYTSVLPPTQLITGTTVSFSVHAATCGGNYTGVLGIWIDYNQDGDFLDSGETVHMSTPFTYGVNVFRTGSFVVPCNVPSGNTRMRVALIETVTSPISPCGTYGYGETEDYMVNIVSGPASFTATNAIQQVGQVGAGSNNVPILRIPVKVNSNACNPGTITQFNFNTAGTTNVSDILAAKLYRTGASNQFNTINLVGTVANPNGPFSFTLADTTINDTNNYWLAYDVSSFASNNNLLDARFDSVEAIGAWRLPINGNPAGAITVSVPMTFLGASASHPTLSQIERGTTNNPMLRIMIRTSSTGAPVAVSQFNLSTNGSINTAANIDSIIVWTTGANPNFVSPIFFGSTGTQNGPFVVNGNRNLLNDTNYFWVTYNVPGTANVGDSVDAEAISFEFGSVTQTITNGAPAGSRKIRAPYCASGATSTFDSDIGSFVLLNGNDTLLNNTVGCGANVTGANGTYSNFTSTVINATKGSTLNFSMCYASSGALYASGAAIYIDFNNNGLWDAGEMVWNSSTTFTGTVTGTFTIPCTAVTGPTRMRLVLIESQAPLTLTNACGTFTWGETEDYTLNIIDGAPTPIAANTIQQTGTTSAGATNVPILRVPLKVLSTPCNPGVVTEFRFNTAGTTNVADILSAKLYKTGSSATFNTANLLGTVAFPSGSFSFFVADTAINDTNNYWLAYDVSGTAPNNNVLDARFDSAEFNSTWMVPLISAPTGNILIASPMTFLGASAMHPTLAKIERGTTNNPMLRIMIRTSSTGSSVPVTQFSLSTNGSINTGTNIDSIIVWTTGANPNFVSPIYFGSTGTQSGPFVVNGIRNLLNDTNYFWVTYNVPGTANVGDSLDAEAISFEFGSVTQTISNGAPAGSRQIRAPYCASGATSSFDSDIGQVTITSGNTTILNNGIGCTPSSNNTSANGTYSNFLALPPANIPAGTIANVTICYVSSGFEYASQAAVYIDFNDNGLWETGEMVWNSTVATVPNVNSILSGSFIVPANTPLGIKRMRVVLIETTVPLTLANACGTFNWGETEDYLVNITPQVSNTYSWTATAPGQFNTPTNWTPNRNIHNVGDRLIFASGGSRVVNDVVTNPVSSIQFTNNTNVTFNAASQVILSGVDTLLLTSGIVNTGNNVVLMSGSADTMSIGYLGHTSGGVNGLLGRWIRNTTGTYNFPLVTANGTNRNLTMTYVNAPTARGTIIATFVPGNPGNAGLPLTDGLITVNRAAENGVFRLTSGNGLTGGAYDLTFRADSFKGVFNVGGLTVIRRVDNTSVWTNPGTFVFASGTTVQPLLARDGLNVYGEFGVGGDTLTNPLPVSLVKFNAHKVNEDVLLSWTTVNEVNNYGFDVERSTDGYNFEPIGFVKGNGNSNRTILYSLNDDNAFIETGVNTLYYRLRQYDFDGSYHYSDVVSVTDNGFDNDNISAYPNPYTSDVKVEIISTKDITCDLVIIDAQGRSIATRTVKLSTGINVVDMTEMNNLNAGIYFIKVQGLDLPALKVIKN